MQQIENALAVCDASSLSGGSVNDVSNEDATFLRALVIGMGALEQRPGSAE